MRHVPWWHHAVKALLVAASLGSIALYVHLEPRWLPVGGACRAEKDCRGLRSRCLPWQHARSGPLGLGVVLPPEGAEGYCTRPCEGHDDCPAPMRCVEVGLFATSGALPRNAFHGRPTRTQKLCARGRPRS